MNWNSLFVLVCGDAFVVAGGRGMSGIHAAIVPHRGGLGARVVAKRRKRRIRCS
jgi:hypothetical protein